MKPLPPLHPSSIFILLLISTCFCDEDGLYSNCNETVRCIISINSIEYRILDWNNTTQILTVARDDYWSKGVCVSDYKNNSFDNTPFQYANDVALVNVTLFYNCPSNSPFDIPRISSTDLLNITCDGEYVYYTLQTVPSSYAAPCTVVVIPVLDTKMASVASASGIVDALKVGFELKWTENYDECKACTDSGGYCGFNNRDFKCFKGNKSKKAVAIGVSVGGAVALVVILGCVYFVVQRRKKIPYKSRSMDLFMAPSSGDTYTSSNTSQSLSSYQSSKSDTVQPRSYYFGVQVFAYEELEEATKNFDTSKEIGEGGFGTVYKGELKDGRTVAVKRLYERNFKRMEQFMNEVEILARLRHKNLVTLFGCTSRHSRELLLVYEFIPNGTVADHLQGTSSKSTLLPWPIRLNIAVETAEALAYLHSKDVIHRDVKTNNILLDDKFCVKVADFGLSRLFPNHVTHVSTAPQGTPGYVDPEYYQCYQLTDKSDVYSFGVVLIELISSLQAVDIGRQRSDVNLANMAVNRIHNQEMHELVDPYLGFETDHAVRKMTTAVAELAFRCLQQERDMRPSMNEVLEILKGIRSDELGAKEETEVLEVRTDEVRLLNKVASPFSPDSVVGKWVSGSSVSNSS